ncbi:MAG: glycosyltransferase family 9 protein [Fimbriimonas sp.]
MPAFLISRLSALGDTVCSLPAAAALKAAFPDARITWAVDPRFAGIVECCTAVDEVVRVKPSFKTIPKYETRFDAALDLQGLLKSGLCIARAKAARKVGYHWQREGSWLFSERVLPDPSSFHIVDQYVDVARAVGGKADRADFAMKPKPDDILEVRRKLKEKGVVGRIVVVNAGAGWVTKRWPPEHFAHVIDGIHREGVRAVLVGGKAPADREAADEVIKRCVEPPADLLGGTSVRELVALIRLASAHIGGDTGSTHLAAALDIPAIGLYSITRPQRSCPYGQIERCFYEEGGLANIRPEPVLERVRDILKP